jgi:DNA-binding transcriptional ArsR family regulator
MDGVVSLGLDRREHFAYHQTMHADFADLQLSKLAAAIAEPARTRMLCCLMDGRARTSTELAVVAEVSPSTASVHLAKLKQQNLLKVVAQGKHRYYQLAGEQVAAALEALLLVAGVPQARFIPNTPLRLRQARTCYDHMAGAVAVSVHDYMMQRGWLLAVSELDTAYELSDVGVAALEQLGLDVAATRQLRRRFACSCLDWSERKPHIGGALGAALLQLMLQRGWVERDLDSRALGVTRSGVRALQKNFAINL